MFDFESGGSGRNDREWDGKRTPEIQRRRDGWLYRRLYIKEYILLGGADWYCKMQIDSKDWNPFGK